MFRPRPVHAFLLGVLAWCGALRAAPWPAVDSDLPAHPQLHEGRLGNGLRFLVLPNDEPRNRVSMRLLVAAGSLHEGDHERGIAHFVEHMAFRGTRRFPAGSVVAALQRLGVGLGPDHTAFTSHVHTIYHLELPDSLAPTLAEGLRVFREYAEAVTFDAKLIEKERGVILSEMAMRDTPTARGESANLGFLWPSAPHVRRPVAGTPEAIRGFKRAQFVEFYNAWYRPERMVVIIVGNVEAAAATREIDRQLGSMKARAPARPEPFLSFEAARPNVAVFSDPGNIGVVLTFQRPHPLPGRRDDVVSRTASLHQALAFGMFHQRLQELARAPDASFISPIASISVALPDWQLATIAASGRSDDWQKVLADVEREHRRAFLFGFTESELNGARAAIAANHEFAVRSAATWHSDGLANQLAASVVAGQVFTAPGELQRVLAGPLAAATLDDCVQAFRAAWSTQPPHVFVIAHPSFNITAHQIADALNRSRQEAITARADAAPASFAYENFGANGSVTREEHLPDLDATLSEFSNGVRLNFKQTDFQKNTVQVHVRVGEGKLMQAPQHPGIDLLADFMLVAGGLGRHTADELRRILAGRSLNVAFHVATDANVFSASCAPTELDLTLQVITAYLTDSAFRSEALREAQAHFGSMYAQLAASPGGPIALRAIRAVANSNSRFGMPWMEEISVRSVPELRTWLEPQLKDGAIEMSIVGDVSWEQARAAVARTLGALPRRDPRADTYVSAKVQPPPAPAPVRLGTHPLLKQGAIAWYWPIPALRSIHEERRCVMLAHGAAERLRQRLREELGAAYNVAFSFEQTPGFPDLNYFALYTEVEPDRLQRMEQTIEHEIRGLIARGLSADEFLRTHQPYLREMTDNLRTNAYWGITVLSEAQANPARIAAARDRASDILTITREELLQLARAHLDPKRAFKFLTMPVSGSAGAPAIQSSGSAAGAGRAGRSR